MERAVEAEQQPLAGPDLRLGGSDEELVQLRPLCGDSGLTRIRQLDSPAKGLDLLPQRLLADRKREGDDTRSRSPPGQRRQKDGLVGSDRIRKQSCTRIKRASDA